MAVFSTGISPSHRFPCHVLSSLARVPFAFGGLMTKDHQRFIIVSGGPGSGKRTLIDALENEGFVRAVEAGRAIIQVQSVIGGTALSWADRNFCADVLRSWDMRSHAMAKLQHGTLFFDRGVPDVIGYLTLCGLPVPQHMEEAARQIGYNRTVFLAPSW